MCKNTSRQRAPFLLFASVLFIMTGRTAVFSQEQGTESQDVIVNTDQAPGSQASGQEASTERPAEPEAHGTRVHWQDLPGNILHDQKEIWTSPFHINRDNARRWLLFSGAAAALIPFDQKISDSLPNTHAQLSAGKWGSRFGADYFIYPMTSVFYFVGKARENPRARDTARLGIESLIDAEITVNILKFATQRPRPTEKDGHGKFWDGGNSFASGHSIKAWALARIVVEEFKDNKFIPPVAYGLASTVVVSRFIARRHFASDNLVGAAMGWFIGDMVYHHHHAPSERSRVAAATAWVLDHVQFQPQQSSRASQCTPSAISPGLCSAMR